MLNFLSSRFWNTLKLRFKKVKMEKLLAVSLAAVFIVSFQNCGRGFNTNNLEFEQVSSNVAENSGNTATPKNSKIVNGWYHSCIMVEQSLSCWGKNNFGQLGDGTFVDNNRPTQIFSSGVSDVAIGNASSCAIVNRVLKCWGQNMGKATDGSPMNSAVPADLTDESIDAISSGIGTQYCGLTSGRVFCWDNARIDLATTKITSGASAISATGTFSCAIVSSALQCWTRAFASALLNITSNTPTQMIDSNVSAVSVGTNNVCAIVNDSLKCWGFNNYGQLGDGTMESKSSPMTVFSSGVTAVSVGNSYICAVVLGALKCMGNNSIGQLGVGENPVVLSPTTVFPAGVTAISAGYDHTCAMVDNRLWCWGNNEFGKLGIGINGNAQLLPIKALME